MAAKEVSMIDGWRNRITGTGTIEIKDVLYNPFNWRMHPQQQQDALEEVLNKVGWVQNVVVNTVTGHLIDGHLRVIMADRKGEDAVPATFVELTEEEERLILLTLDPLGAMAMPDRSKLEDLLLEFGESVGDLGTLLTKLAEDNSIDMDDMLLSPDAFKTFDEDIDTEYRCPKCGYEWSGKARPTPGVSEE